MKQKRLYLWILAGVIIAAIVGNWIAVQTYHQHLVELAGPEQSHADEGNGTDSKTQYTCGMHPMIVTDEPGLCPICNMDLTPIKPSASAGTEGERKIKYWVAPMDPTYIRDEPGKSPMGMDLVPVYEDEATGGSLITIDPVTIQNMGVRTAPVETRDISRTIRTVGLVEYDEPAQYSINTKVAGWIERLYVNQVGQHVGKGQPLLELYSPDLVTAQEEYLLALDNYASLAETPFPEIADGARRLLDATRRRLQLWDISAGQIKRLEQNRQVRKTMTLHSPYSGIVKSKMMNEGGYVTPGMELFEIADISEVWVMADIYEYELPWVSVGQSAELVLPYADGKEVVSSVSYIYPFVEPKTRTVKARIEIDNPDFELKPDMYVNVRLATATVKETLAVPSEAVLYSGEKMTVFVALGNGRFEPRLVKVGATGDQGYTEIKQGLFAGEQVVTSAQFMFDSESKLREAIQKMMKPKNAPSAATQADQGSSADDDLDDLFDDDDEEDLESLFE